MNLAKLFEVQKVLRDRINYNEPDRFNKLVLALLVELGECANEWRGFKFWSKDQLPRMIKPRAPYMDLDDAEFYNPLLEEYVDGLHFVLELGIELGYLPQPIPTFFPANTTIQFVELYYKASELNFLADEFGKEDKIVQDAYQDLFDHYSLLGIKHLGFTWEQIEQAYMDKNKVNHQRQEQGY